MSPEPEGRSRVTSVRANWISFSSGHPGAETEQIEVRPEKTFLQEQTKPAKFHRIKQPGI